MTEWRWLNEFDPIMTATNLNNWTWPKLKPTNLLKLPSHDGLVRLFVTQICTDPTSIFFCRQGNVCRCREFQSNSKIKVRRCEKFSVMFNHYFRSSSFGQLNKPHFKVSFVDNYFFIFQLRAVLAAVAEAEVLAVVDAVADTTSAKDSKQNCEEQIFWV